MIFSEDYYLTSRGLPQDELKKVLFDKRHLLSKTELYFIFDEKGVICQTIPFVFSNNFCYQLVKGKDVLSCFTFNSQ